MKIAVINPNTTQAMTDDIYKAAVEVASPGTSITAITPTFGPQSIETFTDHYVADVAVLSEVYKAHNNRIADGFVIACYGDPGVHAARELVEAPVVGIAEASMHMACMVAPKWSIISILDRCDWTLEEMVRANGMQNKCASIRATGLTVLEAVSDPQKTIRELTRQAELAIKQDGAEAILLGCAGMVPFTRELEQKFGVPVFDGVIAAVKMVEGLVALGKKTSKIRTYAPPSVKEYVGLSGILPF